MVAGAHEMTERARMTRVRATVRAVRDRELEVETAVGWCVARRADGCLLDPEVGDVVVLLSVGAGGWVTDVLERGDGAAVLSARADLEVFAAGSIAVSAAAGVAIGGQGEVSIAAARAHIQAESARVTLQRATLAGGSVSLGAVDLRVVAKTFDTVAERVRSELGRVIRHVLGVDRVRARELDIAGSETTKVRGRATVVQAGETVSAQGGPIQFG